MPTSPAYEGATIADDLTYVGQAQIIGGAANDAAPPKVQIVGGAPVISNEIVGGPLNTANPPEVIVTGFAPTIGNEIVGGTLNTATPPLVYNVPSPKSAATDAFGRLRVSEPNTLLDAKFRFNLLPDLFDQVKTGTGNIARNANTNTAELTVSGLGVGRALFTTHQNYLYRAGQSLLIDMTFLAGNGVAGSTKRIGFFDDKNGIFLQVDSTGWNFVIRSSTSGVVSDANKVQQAAWNLDTLDGSGGASNPSGITLNLSSTQILVIDLQFLGVGRVRCGFNIGGEVIWAQEFLNANVGLTVPYMQTAVLPVSGEVISTAPVPDQLNMICAGVMREGSAILEPCYQGTANTRLVSDNGQSLLQGNSNSRTVIVVGLRTGYSGANLRFIGVEALVTGNKSIYYEVAVVRGYTGGAFTCADCGSISQYSTTVVTAPTAPAVTGSDFVIASGFCGASNGNTITASAAAATAGVITVSDGDLFVVRSYGLTGTTTAQFVLQFEEYY